MSVTVNCIHERDQTIEELAAAQYQQYTPQFSRSIEKRTKWTETSIPIVPDEHEQKLLGAVLNAAIRAHNTLAFYRIQNLETQNPDETVCSIRQDMARETFFLKTALKADTVSESEPSEDDMKTHDDQVCELLRERKLWTSIPQNALWEAGGIKKRRFKTIAQAARLRSSASVLAQAVVTNKAKMRRFSSTKSTGSVPATFPPLYCRLMPVQVQTEKTRK